MVGFNATDAVRKLYAPKAILKGQSPCPQARSSEDLVSSARWEDGSRRTKILGRYSDIPKSEAEMMLSQIVQPLKKEAGKSEVPLFTSNTTWKTNSFRCAAACGRNRLEQHRNQISSDTCCRRSKTGDSKQLRVKKCKRFLKISRAISRRVSSGIFAGISTPFSKWLRVMEL